MQFRMRFSKTFSQNFLLLIISIVISILLVEWAVGKIFFTPAAASIALEEGVNFDTRSRLEVVLDCRKSDKSCYPVVPPHTFLTNKLEVTGEGIVPLSGVARARIIACNEGGFYSTYTTDEFGFRNPAGIWRNTDVVDLAFVGDSYTQGDCVNDGDHFVDHFSRTNYLIAEFLCHSRSLEHRNSCNDVFFSVNITKSITQTAAIGNRD